MNKFIIYYTICIFIYMNVVCYHNVDAKLLNIKYKVNTIISNKVNKAYNTFLIHGVASSASELYELETELINYNIPAISIELKNDPLTSITLDLNKQCDAYFNTIKNILVSKNIVEPINIIGISQGGIISRCIVEKYNDIINVSKLITIAAPNMGVYYNVADNNSIIDKLSVPSEYTFTTIQQYWKDPFDYINYLLQRKFITLLNNEIHHVNYDKYRTNILKIDMFIAIWSDIDTVIKPAQSSIFNYYNITIAEKYKNLELNNLTLTEWYTNDNLGLLSLHNLNKYKSYMIPCIHDEFKRRKCFLNKFNNTVSLFDIIINHIYL